MSSVRELHDEAMRLASLAMIARHRGNLEQAGNLARQALAHESQAAAFIPVDEASEPTRSILHLSAASLAYQCGELATARELITEGLAGGPPPRVKRDLEELRQLLRVEATSHNQ